MKAHLLLLVSVLLLSVPAVHAAILADSVAEFSGVQGQDNWQYGYYAGPFTPAEFVQMTVFSGSEWHVDNETVIDPDIYWTSLSDTRAHGNGTTTFGGRTPVEQWAVRRWIAEVDGPILISGTLAKAPNGVSGNGVVGRIFVNGVESFTQTISGTDTTGVNYSFIANVLAGHAVDFALDPLLANDGSDTSIFTGQISAVPEPATALLVGMAIVFLGGIRKLNRRLR
jgi:hypothetical protein